MLARRDMELDLLGSMSEPDPSSLGSMNELLAKLRWCPDSEMQSGRRLYRVVTQ
jgi:hypothetical protein